MYYVYILKMSDGQHYTGYTSDLRRRISEHNSGSNTTTSKHLPVKLVFYEAFLNEKDARRREEYFKTDKGKTTIKLMLREYLDLK
ncbi:MAG: GIY-YIG nuclease family protein [Candidatus Magasanikbacteria bacterium]|nr:GIY-YIG nuclease family protein [Candidatus Magasanikbacteria bacterium]